MKKFVSLVAVLLAVLLVGFGFVACSDDDDDDTPAASAYLPDEFADKTVSALYTFSKSGTKEGVAFTLVQAIYLFSDDDKTFVVTTSRVTGGETIQRNHEKGTYELSGTVDTGTLTLNFTHSWDGDENSWRESKYTEKPIEIKDGKLTYDENEYTKQ